MGSGRALRGSMAWWEDSFRIPTLIWVWVLTPRLPSELTSHSVSLIYCLLNVSESLLCDKHCSRYFQWISSLYLHACKVGMCS